MDVEWAQAAWWLPALWLVPRSASACLLWTARPAAEAVLPEITSREAVGAMAAGVAAAALTGWQAPALVLAGVAVVRIAMGLSYQRWGGIHAASLRWVRYGMTVMVILISIAPGSGPLRDAR